MKKLNMAVPNQYIPDKFPVPNFGTAIPDSDFCKLVIFEWNTGFIDLNRFDNRDILELFSTAFHRFLDKNTELTKFLRTHTWNVEVTHQRNEFSSTMYNQPEIKLKVTANISKKNYTFIKVKWSEAVS